MSDTSLLQAGNKNTDGDNATKSAIIYTAMRSVLTILTTSVLSCPVRHLKGMHQPFTVRPAHSADVEVDPRDTNVSLVSLREWDVP